MQEKYIMALDQGTTSSRAVIFDHQGKIVSIAAKEFRQIYPRPGWVEHDPMEIWDSQMEAARRAIDSVNISPGNIAAIGITNQRETSILWDRKADNRSTMLSSGNVAGLRTYAPGSRKQNLQESSEKKPAWWWMPIFPRLKFNGSWSTKNPSASPLNEGI